MKEMSKRMIELKKLIDRNKTYTLSDAIDLLKQTAKVKFDETAELHIRLNIDPKKSDQLVRGTVFLPHGIGKTRKIAVIAKGEKLKEAESSGANFVGSDDLIEKIQKGFLEFDVLVATPDAMKDLSKLGKLLGPRGLMPNPKAGTVTFEIAKTVKELKTGRIEYKNDSYGIIHCPVGKVSFEKEKLIENIKTLIESVVKSKPVTVKGQYLRSVTICTSMGPGIRLDVTQKFF
ncbi:MAG: 50S ribosomal protein L1 [Elusimicrobiota bacterium]|nr:50S ribosomal protein L1 [Elusimicrobiota bacterium]